MKSNKIRIGLIQATAKDEVDKNLSKTIAKITEATKKGAKIICLQELFATKYFPQREDANMFNLSEHIPGKTTSALRKSAMRNKITIIGSVFEKRTEGLYHNTAVVISPDGKIIGKYRKMHIPDDPGFYEKYYFAQGDLGFQVINTPLAKLGILVCWDQWYPEAARLSTLRGAQILFYPTAIGWHNKEPSDIAESQLDAWVTIQRSHAIANGIFVASVNRVGTEDELIFWGSSFVAEPSGRIIAKASRDKEEILIADCDLSRIEEQRNGWPFLRDRRIDAYQGITLRFVDYTK